MTICVGIGVHLSVPAKLRFLLSREPGCLKTLWGVLHCIKCNMDHSMMTTIEAVNMIRENCQDKSVLWRINTEEEYHEETKG